MKCTWPNCNFCVGDPTQPVFHALARVGVLPWGNANFMFCFGGNAHFSIFRYQYVGIPNTIFHVGGLSQWEEPTQVFLHRSGI